MSPLLRNLLFAFGLALILWLGYTVFFRESGELVTVEGGVSDVAVQGQEFLTTLTEVRAISLNGAVLNDPRFESLVDQRQDVTPEDVGRQNPFLPVDGR